MGRLIENKEVKAKIRIAAEKEEKEFYGHRATPKLYHQLAIIIWIFRCKPLCSIMVNPMMCQSAYAF